MKIRKRMRMLSVIMIIFLLFETSSSSIKAFAETAQKETFTDGSYLITVVTTNETLRSTKQGSKTAKYYNSSNELLWSFTVDGEFTYTGSYALCTSVSCSYNMVSSAWKASSTSTKKNGNQASASITAKSFLQTIDRTITLTCSNSGILS